MKIIFFDNSCSICSKEISYYKSISKKDAFLWCDLFDDSQLLKRFKISHKEALMALHAIDEKGKIYKGIDAFSLIWQELPYWRIFSWFINLPMMNQLAKFIYNLLAQWRFNQHKYCELE